ncbi:HD-GYP domain-containing protein [Parazoarcus communis]|uniref:HD-GYP domain-containing protein n=1 Tax=Parazoarcus communis TaxID=41977 RepID=UPI00131F237B|nr:HD-GYP domain-containing protein [Parazoarcus communis]
MFNKLMSSAGDEQGVAIDPARLCPGLFVRLDLGWMAHDFMFNQFRITSATQVRELQALGLTTITYYPARSTARPLDLEGGVPSGAADAGAGAAGEGISHAEGAENSEEGAGAGEVLSPVEDGSGEAEDPAAPRVSEKEVQAQRLAARRAEIAQCERRYAAAAAGVKSVMRDVFPAGDKAVSTARKLVGDTVDGLAEAGEIVIHLMNEKLADETAYFHVLNVMVLSILLGRELKLPPEILRVLGEAALFHDIGKLKVPETVLRNDKRNRHEEDFFRLHTTYGREIARELGGLAAAACDVIEHHHERMDGKGYPKGLSGQHVPLLARLVGITNHYDNLCNPLSLDAAMTPAEALTHMFRNESEAWDKAMLQAFIRLLGVYPPGSLVQLSNGNIALVVAVNHADLLRPSVMVFDPSTPREDALVVDLIEHADVEIDVVLNPRELDRAALAYLSPRRKMSYYHSKRT